MPKKANNSGTTLSYAEKLVYGLVNQDANATLSSKSRNALKVARRPVAGLWRGNKFTRQKPQREVDGD